MTSLAGFTLSSAIGRCALASAEGTGRWRKRKEGWGGDGREAVLEKNEKERGARPSAFNDYGFFCWSPLVAVAITLRFFVYARLSFGRLTVSCNSIDIF